jgi:hypothetical protein
MATSPPPLTYFRKVMNALEWGAWEEAKSRIAETPEVLWMRGHHSFTPMDIITSYGRIDMMNYIADILLAFREKGNLSRNDFECISRLVFEGWKGDAAFAIPICEAIWYGHVTCIAFLADHAPSGSAVLETYDTSWDPPSLFNQPRWYSETILGYLARHMPSGTWGLERCIRTNNANGPRTQVEHLIESDHMKHNLPRASSSFSSFDGGGFVALAA